MRCQTQEKRTYSRDNLWVTDVHATRQYSNVAVVGETEDFFSSLAVTELGR